MYCIDNHTIKVNSQAARRIRMLLSHVSIDGYVFFCQRGHIIHPRDAHHSTHEELFLVDETISHCRCGKKIGLKIRKSDLRRRLGSCNLEDFYAGSHRIKTRKNGWTTMDCIKINYFSKDFVFDFNCEN